MKLFKPPFLIGVMISAMLAGCNSESVENTSTSAVGQPSLAQDAGTTTAQDAVTTGGATAKKPTITKAGLNMQIAGDQAILGVTGTNLSGAELFLRSGSESHPIPLDVKTETELGVLDLAFESLIKPGTWDVVVRTPGGEAVAEKAITKPAP